MDYSAFFSLLKKHDKQPPTTAPSQFNPLEKQQEPVHRTRLKLKRFGVGISRNKIAGPVPKIVRGVHTGEAQPEMLPATQTNHDSRWATWQALCENPLPLTRIPHNLSPLQYI